MANERSPLLKSDKTRYHKTVDRVALLFGMADDVLILLALVAANFLPPPDPMLPPEQVVEHYRTHDLGIKISGSLWVCSGFFWPVYIAGLTNQLKKIPGVSPTIINYQTIFGAVNTLILGNPGIILSVNAYRLDKDPQLTVLFNDLFWIALLIPFPVTAIHGFSIAWAIIQDKSPRRLFPLWLAYLNIILPITWFPALAMHFVYSGPVAWNGFITFWVAVFGIGLQFGANNWCAFQTIEIDPLDLDALDDEE